MTPESEKLEIIKEDILSSYDFQGEKIITEILLYTLNSNSVRIDIGLVPEEDTVVAQKRSEDIRTRIPQYFQQEGISVTEQSFASIGQSFGQFIIDRTYSMSIVSFLAITVYLMFAFRKSIEGTSSFIFGAITLVTLLHDVIVAPGLYVLLSVFFPALKIDVFFVTALLTIL